MGNCTNTPKAQPRNPKSRIEEPRVITLATQQITNPEAPVQLSNIIDSASPPLRESFNTLEPVSVRVNKQLSAKKALKSSHDKFEVSFEQPGIAAPLHRTNSYKAHELATNPNIQTEHVTYDARVGSRMPMVMRDLDSTDMGSELSRILKSIEQKIALGNLKGESLKKILIPLNEVHEQLSKRTELMNPRLAESQALSSISEETVKGFKGAVIRWLGRVYEQISTSCFNYYYKKELTENEMKCFYSENLILNLLNLIRYLEQFTVFRQNIEMQFKTMEFINECSQDILTHLCKVYPQTEKHFPDKQLEKRIQNLDHSDKIQFDLLTHAYAEKELQVSFEKKPSGNYSGEIMQFINYLIRETGKEKKTFTEDMEQLFKLTNIANSSNSSEKTSNISFKIGTKIKNNTPEYTEQEINSGVFTIKSPAILRIMTKWLEELQKKIDDPEKYIVNRVFPFRRIGSNEPDSRRAKILLNEKILAKVQGIKKLIKQLKREFYILQYRLMAQNWEDGQLDYLDESQKRLGIFATTLASTIPHNYSRLLNKIIHSLNQAVEEARKDEHKPGECNVDLLSFKVADLLRCKCSSNRKQDILSIYDKIISMCRDSKSNFSLVRTKNRLNEGTRDVMLNLQYKGKLLCEVQLSITGQLDQKQIYLDHFNHYLYELRRANFGPIIEICILWKNLEQKAETFENLSLRKNLKSQIEEEFEETADSILCDYCFLFCESKSSLLKNRQGPYTKMCGECFFEYNKLLVQRLIFQKQHPSLAEQISYTQKIRSVKDYAIVVDQTAQNHQTRYQMFRPFTKAQEVHLLVRDEASIENIKKVVALPLNSKKRFSKYKIFKMSITEEPKLILYKDLLDLQKDGANLIFFSKINRNLVSENSKIPLVITEKGFTKYIWGFSIDDAQADQYIASELRHKKLSEFLDNKSDTLMFQGEDLKSTAFEQLMASNQEKIQQRKNDINKIFLRVNNLDSLDFLEPFREVESLYLSENQLTRFPASYFPNLRDLDLKSNKFSQLIELKNLPRLQKLDISNNIFTEFAVTDQNNALQELNLSYNKIYLFTGLHHLKVLKTLDLSRNEFGSFTIHSENRSLLNLYLQNNKLILFSGMKNLVKLQTLDLSENEFSDFIIRQSNKSIQTLRINGKVHDSHEGRSKQGRKIKQFNGFQYLTNLKVLELRYNQLEQFEVKGIHNSIAELYLNYNKIKIFTGVGLLNGLRKLDVSNNSLTDFILQKSNESIIELLLAHNKLTTFEKIHLLPKLEYLKLEANNLSDFRVQKEHYNIKTLVLDHNPISRIIGIHKMRAILEIYIQEHQIGASELAVLKSQYPKLIVQ